MDVHEVGCSKESETDDDENADIEQLHQTRNKRNEKKLRDARPGEDHADLLGVVSLYPGQVDRQHKDRAVEGNAEHEVGDDTETEVATDEKAQVQQRVGGLQ